MSLESFSCGVKHFFTRQVSCQTLDDVEPFIRHEGKLAAYPDDNVDTDRIIPARFLSMVTKSGYGDLLFADVDPNSPSKKEVREGGATVLVVGSNFGCGSSREHAVWAIQQAGYRAVIAKRTPTSLGYSDIFRQNAANCGLLLIELNEHDHAQLLNAGKNASVAIDLPAQTITCGGRAIEFEINSANKEALLDGRDLIGTTLVHEDSISRYEAELACKGGR